jgi:CBS domain-containing protein
LRPDNKTTITSSEENVKTLSQLLGAPRTAAVAVTPRETISHAVTLMTEHGVGAVVVMKNGHAVGVVTEQDCQGQAAGHRVQDIMTPVVCASQQTTVRDAMAIMAERQVSHLPVLDDFKDVVGLVSMGTLAETATSGSHR